MIPVIVGLAVLVAFGLIVAWRIQQRFVQSKVDAALAAQEAKWAATTATEKQLKLRALVDQSASLIILTDDLWGITFIAGGGSSALAAALRVEPGMKLDRCFTYDSLRTVAETVGSLAPGKASRSMPLIIQAGGREFHVECSVIDRRSEAAMAGLLWTVTDATERFQAARDLSVAHDRLTAILTNLNVSIWSALPDGGGMLYVSAGEEDIYGRPAAEFFANPSLWREAIHPDDREEAERSLTAQIQAKGQACAEYRIVRPDGSIRWVANHICPIRNESGELVRLDGSVDDITEQRLDRLAREETEQRYNRMVARVPGIVYQFRLAPDGAMSMPFISTRAEEYVGFTAKGIMENCDLLLGAIHEDDFKGMYDAIVESATSLGQFLWEGRVYTTPDEFRWFKVTANPERCSDGSILWDGLMFDVTTLRAAEEAAREKEAAEQANLAKSEFLSRMSHELRTPLNAILGFGQLLEMQVADDSLLEMIGHLNRAGRHLLSLINEVLEISRIESRTLHVSCEPLDVGPLIEEVCDLLMPLASDKQVRMVHESNGEPRYAHADAQRLRQVLMNIVANAIKYNSVGGLVTLAARETEGDHVEISIRDNGPGIPANRKSRLFTAFDRLGAEGTVVEGTGLGLALSKRLVEVMGGSIHMEDAEGGGCVFIVTLDGADPNVSDMLGLRPVAALARKRTVLYIEDNFASARLMENLANHVGARLSVMSQGLLGFESAKSMKPDVIFLDLDLPDVNGMEVLGLLKNDPATRDIPVVIVSADATMARRERAMQNGAAGYLGKPFEVREVIDLLRQEWPIGGNAG